MYRRISKGPRIHQPRDADPQRPRSQNESDIADKAIHAHHAIEVHWAAEERHHHFKERWYWGLNAGLTFVAVIGAIATVILSILSLREAQRATSEARNATSEAHRQAEAEATQADVATRALRPYIFVDSVSRPDLLPQPFTPNLSAHPYQWYHTDNFRLLEWRIQINNYGRIPAIVKDVRCVFVITEVTPTTKVINLPIVAEHAGLLGSPGKSEQTIINSAPASTIADCGPSAVTLVNVSNERDIDLPDWKAQQMRNGYVWMLGAIDYENFFSEEKYITFFCFNFDKNTGYTGVMHRGPPSCDKRT